MLKLRGFILQASYRIVSGPAGSRTPVIHIYGRLEDGGTFLVRDDRQRPHFYIRTADLERASHLTSQRPIPLEKRTFLGEPVSRFDMETPGDVPGLRDRLHDAGIDTYEADVRFAIRYLIERGIKGGCEIEGEATPGESITWTFDNPVMTPADVRIEPRVLSFDIETDGKGERLLAISMYSNEIDEVLIVDGSDRPMPEKATRCLDEYSALNAFCERIQRLDPDVITGWNIIDFDLTMLQRLAQRLRHPFNLGRDAGAIRIRKAEGYFGSGQASIPGRLVMDGIDLLRGAFVRMEDYSLDAVAREVLGEGKAVHGDVRDRLAEILHNYRNDLPAFALYARTDARLAYEIVAKLNVIQLAVARSQLTGMTPDRVAASIASFDFLYLSELEKRGIVAPTVRSSDARVYEAQQGGHVLEPLTGLHKHVWVFDFKSLYPSIIRTFNIDPLSYVARPEPDDDLIETPGGAFRREPAILPRLLDDLFPRRDVAKKNGDEVASGAIKILMNSCYGVLGTPACRFYNPALANSITGTGREILLWSKQWFESAGYTVLYGDTDSLFVRSGMQDAEEARAQGKALAARLNQDIARYIDGAWRVTSKLELKFEKLYLRLFLPRARGSTRGASKRYAGLLNANDIDGVQFVGMEVVRRDWTALAKQVQRELYHRLFTDQPVDIYLAGIVGKVRDGKLDDALVYKKSLRKDTEEYTATTPPHVVAARKSTQPLGRLISYVITTGGPEPIDNIKHPLDREHYVIKQIKPVAEPVLATLGLDFEQVIGDSRQMDLYSLLDVH
ncbi:DNA polymerase II [Steroidobacter sp. S1-65]|uniref:DNA polymerase n=1 Tax=Steroidobacter gossypii TaxID=2805490 RepID=A0ABS1WXR1_9GAMM|nr:DNA polymerase II [Steroidobacter gossypii]MBM0105765.1 DNA polymerase II [Steroidobacter gossypii]